LSCLPGIVFYLMLLAMFCSFNSIQKIRILPMFCLF